MRVRLFLSYLFVLLIVSGVLIGGCATSSNAGHSPGASPDSRPVSPVTTAAQGTESATEVQSVVDANNQFAFDLYKKLKDDPANSGKNIFFSPFSISSAMAITYEGANGTTADEIRKVFYFPNDSTTMREGYSGLTAATGSDTDTNSSLRMANALWAEKTYPFLTEYTRTADRYYDAGTTNLDFQNNPEGSVKEINRWIEERTDGKVRDLLSQQDIDPQFTRLIITNAIFFSGKWEHPFNKEATGPWEFWVGYNNSVPVQMMSMSNVYFNYTELSDNTQVVELPYTKIHDSDLSMVIILPRDLADIPSVENSLTAERLGQIRQSMKSTKMGFVSLPKFTLESRYSLPETLQGMGMRAAFNRSADFSGMDGKPENLYVDTVIHEAFVDVNEEGTQAAAATSVMMKSQGESHDPIFFGNHPFLFIIQDRDNGNVLFMGRVMNPNGT